MATSAQLTPCSLPGPGADILGHRARLTPEQPAVVVIEPELRLNYRELDQRAVRCARLWTELLGLEKGDRVGILAHNRIEYLEAFFAAGKTGIILVTLGTRLTAVELEHVVSDSGLRALMWDGALADTVGALRERVTLEYWLALDPPEVATGAHLNLSYQASTYQDSTSQDSSYQDLASQLIESPHKTFAITPCHGEDPYCLLYTSGTTGRPKGVIIPHRQILWNGFNTVCGWQLQADDVSPIFTPLYHAGGLLAFLVPIFMIGGKVVLHRDFDASEIWHTFERERCTVALGVPAIWKMLLEAPEFEQVDLSSVRWLISGGAPLPHFLIDEYQRKGISFKQGFGMTEVGVNCFAMTVEDAANKAGSIGKPMMFTEVRLVDTEGHKVADGEVGELLFRGPHVCQGYWRHAEATSATIDDDGWLHSGDQARRDEDGYFFVAGRQKDMFISGGVNVYPAEIEAVLVQHPAVEDAAVVGIPHERWGEVGVAFLVIRESDIAARDDDWLASFLGQHLARYKIPKDFCVVNQMPRTPYGKVVKRELREAYLGESS